MKWARYRDLLDRKKRYILKKKIDIRIEQQQNISTTNNINVPNNVHSDIKICDKPLLNYKSLSKEKKQIENAQEWFKDVKIADLPQNVFKDDSEIRLKNKNSIYEKGTKLTIDKPKSQLYYKIVNDYFSNSRENVVMRSICKTTTKSDKSNQIL